MKIAEQLYVHTIWNETKSNEMNWSVYVHFYLYSIKKCHIFMVKSMGILLEYIDIDIDIIAWICSVWKFHMKKELIQIVKV